MVVAEWSGRRVQSPENRQGSNPEGLAEENRKRQEHGENTLVDLEHTIIISIDRQKTQV